MGFKNIYLTLDNMPSNGYLPGSTVNGRVIISAYESIRIRSLIIKVYGEAKVRFTDTVNTRTTVRNRRNQGRYSETSMETEVFTGYENYISTSYTILGETYIIPGEKEFTFSVILPSILPSSFSGPHGSIRYWIKIKMDKAWNFDQVASAEFKVFSPRDLNTIDFITSENGKGPQPIGIPCLRSETKHFNFLCCRTGPLSLTVELPKSGVVPLETLYLTIEVDNATNVTISSVKVTLLQEVKWMANSPRFNTKTTTNPLLMVNCEGVPQRNNRSWRQPIIIPENSCINIDACSIIKLQYFIMVEAIPEGMHMRLTLKTPLAIGTVPLGTDFSHPRRTYDPHIGFPQPPPPGFIPPATNPGFSEPQNSYLRPSAPNKEMFDLPPPYPLNPDTSMSTPLPPKKI